MGRRPFVGLLLVCLLRPAAYGGEVVAPLDGAALVGALSRPLTALDPAVDPAGSLGALLDSELATPAREAVSLALIRGLEDPAAVERMRAAVARGRSGAAVEVSRSLGVWAEVARDPARRKALQKALGGLEERLSASVPARAQEAYQKAFFDGAPSDASVRFLTETRNGVQEVSVELTHLDGKPLAKKESFGAEVPATSHPELFKTLASNFGLMFVIAPHMPRRIQVDFPLSPAIAGFIGDMYRSSGLKPPEISAPARLRVPRPASAAGAASRSIVAYSAGKDSVYNYIREVEAKGAPNVQALHYALLNPGVGTAELDATKEQIKKFPIPQARILKVRNGTKNRGHAIVQAREFLMLALAVPFALDFGAEQILTEGSYDDEDDYFGGKVSGFHKFNALLEKLRIPVKARWIEIPQLDVLRFVLDRRPEWLRLVRNCFSPAVYAGGYRAAWERHAPKLAKLILKSTVDNCGSCIKCRITNLAVLLQNPERLKRIPKQELAYFVKKVRTWAQENKEKHKDFIDDKLWQGLKILEDSLD